MSRTIAIAFCLTLGMAALAQDTKEPPPVGPEKKEPPAVSTDKKEPALAERLKKVKGTFTLVATVQVKKGEEKAMIEAAGPLIIASRKEGGCKRYELHQDAEDATRFTFVERWDSGKALEEHFEKEHTKKFLEVLGKIAEGPPKLTIAKRRAEPAK